MQFGKQRRRKKVLSADWGKNLKKKTYINNSDTTSCVSIWLDRQNVCRKENYFDLTSQSLMILLDSLLNRIKKCHLEYQHSFTTGNNNTKLNTAIVFSKRETHESKIQSLFHDFAGDVVGTPCWNFFDGFKRCHSEVV